MRITYKKYDVEISGNKWSISKALKKVFKKREKLLSLLSISMFISNLKSLTQIRIDLEIYTDLSWKPLIREILVKCNNRTQDFVF